MRILVFKVVSSQLTPAKTKRALSSVANGISFAYVLAKCFSIYWMRVKG